MEQGRNQRHCLSTRLKSCVCRAMEKEHFMGMALHFSIIIIMFVNFVNIIIIFTLSLSFIHARRAIDHSFNAIYATKSSILKINVIDIKFKRRKPLKGPITKFACVPLDHNWVPSSDWKSFFMFTKRLEIFFFTDILSNLL